MGVDVGMVFGGQRGKARTPIQGLDMIEAFSFSAPPRPSLWLGVLLGLTYTPLSAAFGRHLTALFYSNMPTE